VGEAPIHAEVAETINKRRIVRDGVTAALVAGRRVVPNIFFQAKERRDKTRAIEKAKSDTKEREESSERATGPGLKPPWRQWRRGRRH
jgi:hypothetical protein